MSKAFLDKARDMESTSLQTEAKLWLYCAELLAEGGLGHISQNVKYDMKYKTFWPEAVRVRHLGSGNALM